jgi:hypothetical protein
MASRKPNPNKDVLNVEFETSEDVACISKKLREELSRGV